MNEKIKIDSFKLRIPFNSVEIIDSKFNSNYQKIYSETGEIDEYINLDKHKVFMEKGITTRIAIVHSVDSEGGGNYYAFQINAKQLKNRYFEGITKKNIKRIYKYIIDFKIVYFSYESFLNGLISDIDICLDFEVTQKAMQVSNQKIFENVLPHFLKYVSKPFAKKENTGLQFNDRAKATPTKPYLKIYHKTTELEFKSFEFSNEYLKGIDYNNLGRLEYTIKNSKHKRYIGLYYNTLADFLSIEYEQIEKIFYAGIKCYTMSNEIVREYKNVSPTDRIIIELLNRLIFKGDDKQNIYSILNVFEVPQEKSRMKKKLTDLLENIDDKKRLIENQEVMNMMRILRLNL